MKLTAWMAALAVSAGLSSVSFAQITGTAKLDGEAPEAAEIEAIKNVKECAAQHAGQPVYEETYVVSDDGGLANVVVSIKFEEGAAPQAKAPTKPAVLDQKGCQYTPHVLAMMVDQPILVKNSDKFLHNVHGFPLDNAAFNFAQPTVDQGKKVGPMKVAERFSVKCDVHPWMLAHFHVFDHPFFAVSDKSGKFTLPTQGLPDGTYTLEAWHESQEETQTKEIEVQGGKVTEPIELSFTAAAAAAPADVGAEVRLASATLKAAAAEDETCADGKVCCDAKKAKGAAKPAVAKAE